MGSIRHLPKAVHSSVRSGIMLFDLTRVVEELIFNSLDAGASKVSIAVAVGTCCIKVVDNGSGITRDGLVLLGEKYATSKVDHLADMDVATGSFGFRGEALGSISDVSLLEIVTKAHRRPNGYRKIIKGCKCVYLGIDDSRQDVGTTVIIRDLFYNQPVRRKHMQSSPKKVLHSVKKCVLRIALVHPKVSFKVVDIESDDELLCTYASPSPLSLLTSGFGFEVSSTLHELDVSHGEFKLSGYISGPCVTSSVKAFHYFYINSRYICKGPLHKLLNQLATRFNCVDLWKANTASQNGKQNRSQTYAAYILNLRCPRSCYDLAFEPSKTSVVFKDWIPILSFIEKTITEFWSENTTYGESHGHGSDKSGKGNMWKEGDNMVSAEEGDSYGHGSDKSGKGNMWKEGDNMVSAEEANYEIAKKRCRIQNHQASFGLPSPLLGMIAEESDHKCHRKDSIFWKSHQNSTEFEEHRTGVGFVSQTDQPFQSFDGSLAVCRVTVNQESDSLWASDDNTFFAKDNFLRNKFFATEKSNQPADNIMGSRWEDACLNVDANMNNGFTRCALSCDVDEVSNDLKKPFLQSCSSRRSLPPDGASFLSDGGFEFQTDGFRTKWKRLDSDDSVDVREVDDGYQDLDLCSGTLWQDEAASGWSSPKLLTKVDMHTGLEKGFPQCALSCDCFYDVDEVSNDLKKPFLQSCSSRRTLPPDGASFSRDEGFEFQTDGFRAKRMRFDSDDSVDVREVDDGYQDLDFCSGTLWQEEAASDMHTGLEKGKLITKCDMHTGLDFLSRDSEKSFPIGGECLAEENDLPPDSVDQTRKFGSSHWSSDSEWSSPLFRTKYRDMEHFMVKSTFKRPIRCDDSSRYNYWADREGKDCMYIYDNMRNSSSREYWSASNCTDILSDIKSYAGSKEDISRFLQGHSLDDVFSPNCSNMFANETEWLCLDSHGNDSANNYAVPSDHIPSSVYLDKVENQRDHIIYEEEKYVRKRRPRRSLSAPPLYRGKKKFFALNNHLTMEAAEPNSPTILDASTSRETSELKRSQLSSVVRHLHSKPSSVEDLSFFNRPDRKETSVVIEIPKCEMQKKSQGLDIYNKDSAEDTTSKEFQDSMDSGLKWRNSCPHTANGDRSPNLHNQDFILDIFSGLLHLSGDSLVPEAINKKCLKEAKVLQQVDKKFIPVVAGEVLAIIDQHAADERIRLEELRHKVLSGETKTITHLDAEKELVLPEIGYQLLHNYAEQVQNWGWICNIHAHDSRSFKKNLNLLHRQPSVVTLLAVPCILGVNLSEIDLLEFLQQLADTDGSSTIPPSVHRILSFKACRGAIMFGDTLLPSECSLLVEELKLTSLCFQCAHGRPTTVPLVNLGALHQQISMLGLENGDSNEMWHGLRRHKLSVERAAQRLSSSGDQC